MRPSDAAPLESDLDEVAKKVRHGLSYALVYLARKSGTRTYQPEDISIDQERIPQKSLLTGAHFLTFKCRVEGISDAPVLLLEAGWPDTNLRYGNVHFPIHVLLGPDGRGEKCASGMLETVGGYTEDGRQVPQLVANPNPNPLRWEREDESLAAGSTFVDFFLEGIGPVTLEKLEAGKAELRWRVTLELARSLDTVTALLVMPVLLCTEAQLLAAHRKFIGRATEPQRVVSPATRGLGADFRLYERR